MFVVYSVFHTCKILSRAVTEMPNLRKRRVASGSDEAKVDTTEEVSENETVNFVRASDAKIASPSAERERQV